MSKLQPARGTRDLLPEDNFTFRWIEETAYHLTKKYGYKEIKTPIFEFSEVFHRTLGETSDVINKETYSFTDRGGENITLRPEGTAGVARAFISNGLAQHIPLKYYYSGPMFRYERPQKGRYRQFYQLGVECLGLETPMMDVESVAMAWDFLDLLGIANKCQLEINSLGDLESRQKYREELIKYFSQHKEQLSTDSQVRLSKNPLRILDSKEDSDKKLIANAPQFSEFLNESSKSFFTQVTHGLEKLKIPYNINEKLVRGLDYYCHTVFEFTTTELGAQGTVLGGGRYDGLVELMGGPRTPGIGWAAGIDRLADLTTGVQPPSTDKIIAIIGADSSGEWEALSLSHKLRSENFIVETIFSGGNVGKKIKRADKIKAQFAIIIGQTELDQNQFAVKNLISGEQKNIPRSELITYLK